MASTSLMTTAAEFSATIQRTKNRLVAVPAETQRVLGLRGRPNNHLVHVSIRQSGSGRWNHHYFKLTHDNEFAIPTDVKDFGGGDRIDVKVHRVIADEPLKTQGNDSSGADLLLELARKPRPGWRADGSSRLDEYLDAQAHD